MKNYLEFVKNLEPDLKKNSFFIFLTYFFALFSYPLVRSSTQAIFYESYTSNDYAFATFISVVFLIIVIGVNNKIQLKVGIHKLYLGIGLISIALLIISYLLHANGIKEFAYVLFAIKEAYIVLLIHMCLAFSNAYFSLEQVKRLYGPLGAMGSLGGIIGGALTSLFAQTHGTTVVFYSSLVLIFCTTITFYQTKDAKVDIQNKKEEKPLQSIQGVGKYVFFIACIVALTQFIIFIADLQFNIVFEKMIETKDQRTAYLGQLYSFINVVTLFLQFVVLPYLLVRVKIKNVFYFVPVLYLILIFGGLGFGASTLIVVAGVFVSMKATDYSIFAVAKEVMYHPLAPSQKYGAKYITDMFIYRVSKALIAFVMSIYLIKDMMLLNIGQSIFISLWLICIVYLFREQKNKNLFSKE